MNLRRPLRVSLMIAPLLLLPVPAARALQQDRDQPVKVNAASVNMNEKTGVTVYRGNVVLVQGSLRIDADQVEVRTRHMRMDTVTAVGRPVRLRALLDNREDELKASAERLVLYAETRSVDLSGNVHLRQGGDQFSAQHLHYALDEQHISAKGGDNTDERVYAIIQPSPSSQKQPAQKKTP